MDAIARAQPLPVRARRHLADRIGDHAMQGLTLLAALAAIALLVAIAYKVIDGANPALAKFGVGFLGHTTWNTVINQFGAGDLLFGTVVTSAMALLIGAPLAIAIGLYLSELAPRGARGVIGSLVEMLAAIPSVVLGLWGILVLGPFLANHIEPGLHDGLGFIPLFGSASTSGTGFFTAGLILTIMVVPIIASISRELFLTVPVELREAGLALGATRWEVVRGVVLSSARPGVAAASILGLGRALGEAVAVSMTIGGIGNISSNLFSNGDSLGSRIVNQFQGADPGLWVGSLFYLGLILLVIGLFANLGAQAIVRRFELQHGTVV